MTFQELVSNKVSLEFGNQEQIAAIDREIMRLQEIEERERLEGDEENLKTYHVEFSVSGTAIIEVDAHDEEEAREKAEEEYCNADPEIDDYEIVDIYPIGIVKDIKREAGTGDGKGEVK